MLEAVEASVRHDMGGASVDAGAALALAGAFGVDGRAAAFLIAQSARGIAAGQAKRQASAEQDPQQQEA
ncbi:hypothetical protein KTR66_19365 [Roseococcus sp. SDR]|uniref:hypothetical protein n=1 Tax=Roseococcus sp. SDR TaxID=2835532 RepID=UPI001BCE21B9|nr:hypothetical protein [Roseococcus sp. SDR]MBS7792167.1 hypothetical protein [Roseococcus sp. SDR]MBV1847481.1 hypothetical protein [Roseococcus sp. SDR]